MNRGILRELGLPTPGNAGHVGEVINDCLR